MSERLTKDEEAALRKAWAAVGDWEQTTPEEEHECPVCGGEGYVDGVRYDATAACPATVVGYGIGEGLAAAELLAVSTGPLLATLDAERAKVARLREALARLMACLGGNAGIDLADITEHDFDSVADFERCRAQLRAEVDAQRVLAETGGEP